MKVTVQMLKKKHACVGGLVTFKNQFGDSAGLKEVVEWCIGTGEEKTIGYALWLLPRVMTKEQKVRYAIFAAREVIGIFEKKFPKDKRPRQAIEAAEAWLKDPSEKKRACAYAASADAAAASYAASADAAAASYAASDSAAYAVDRRPAADAAAYACAAACAAAGASADAAACSYAAAAAAASYTAAAARTKARTKARREMQEKCLRFGMGLLETEDEA